MLALSILGVCQVAMQQVLRALVEEFNRFFSKLKIMELMFHQLIYPQ